MKKHYWILAIFLLLAAFLLTYQLLNFRKPCQWKLAREPADYIKKTTRKNHLHQILFYNDIYQNYNSFSPKDNLPKTKFTAHLSSLSVLKGKKETKNGFLLVTGKEIAIAAWDIARLMKSHHLDLIELELLTSRNAAINVFTVPKTTGIINKIKISFNETILGQIPRGDLIKQTSFVGGKKRQFKTIPIHLTKALEPDKTPLAGILVKVKPIKEHKSKVKVKIKNVRLLNLGFKCYEKMPHLDYFKYGGLDRRQLKSVFIPAGSTLTYTIPIETAPNQALPQKLFLDGYLGSVEGKPLTFKITINKKTVVLRETSTGKDVSFFKSEIEPRQHNLKMSITVSGQSGGTGVLGNMSIYRNFPRQRNVVFYLVDALRADKCGIRENLFGNHFKDGAIFTAAYANASRTADSLPGIFTGKYKFTLVDKDKDIPHVDEKEYLLAEYFKTKGYTTAAFINNPWLERSNTTQGFDWVNHCWEHVPKASAFPSKADYNNLKYGDMRKHLHEFVQQNKHKPVFIYIHTMETHIPYEPPRDMRKYSTNADPAVLKTLFKKLYPLPAYHQLSNPEPEYLKILKSLYKDEVLIAHDFFKKAYEYLETKSIINQFSLFILTSDHSERFYEHGSWVHGPPDVYNEVLHIPFMIKGPGIKPGVYDKNVQLLDIYPTIMDWFGDKPPKNLVGTSLMSYMNKNEEGFNNRIIYIDGTGDFPHYAFVKGKIKVIINGNKTEVYDLRNDPNETVNLQKDPRFKEIIAEAKTFRKKFKKTGKPTKKRRQMSEYEKQRLKTLGYIE
jgi:arylsulfatase A-like enzyme